MPADQPPPRELPAGERDDDRRWAEFLGIRQPAPEPPPTKPESPAE